jgi:hypothetical protein
LLAGETVAGREQAPAAASQKEVDGPGR